MRKLFLLILSSLVLIGSFAFTYDLTSKDEILISKLNNIFDKKVLNNNSDYYTNLLETLRKIKEIYKEKNERISNLVKEIYNHQIGNANIFCNYFKVNTGNNNKLEVMCFSETVDKPIIYLYPTKKEKVTVKLDFNGKLLFTYPDYNNKIGGREVLANPSGKLINLSDNREYSYLFREGVPFNKFSEQPKKGFIIEGSKIKSFLQNKLSEIGLKPSEYNEFIVYRLPKMERNKYNLIYFAKDEYQENAKLEITPTPNSILRVFMIFKKIEKPYKIIPQTFDQFKRKGFTVIEWGGLELK